MRVMPFFFVLFLLAAPVAAREAPLPPAQAFAMSYARKGDEVRLRWVMPKGYYLYREHITAADAQGRTLNVRTPNATLKADPTFGPVEVYYGTARADIRHKGAITLSYRGCQEDGLCYIPIRVVIPAR
ncbi:protein-disulfide reductase DsbD family protein [Asticcacaulis sp. BYS171W]|uniref:Protein-disulfide reductase DsbD family protein n=1 Tax=Asticcacaulis aquaticus TaxID=2984212 RepID=A0ABT5HTC6_9CAUL|nr:protein-disulfide reductase DsbD domain-containing protein [Asticcacaulis aquaticus]MDC7683307.1 protein-disulfide reductase DsbD family protein [Asticcacaulis aquaticus]